MFFINQLKKTINKLKLFFNLKNLILENEHDFLKKVEKAVKKLIKIYF